MLAEVAFDYYLSADGGKRYMIHLYAQLTDRSATDTSSPGLL